MHLSSGLAAALFLSGVWAKGSPCHQNPQKAPPVPIIALSDEYMANRSIAPARSERYPPFLLTRDDGPIQCGPGKPCLDGSCCNSAGKCGFGPEHCSKSGPAHCLYNCTATAMCGRDSSGGKVKCGENLCCSYYGWCGTTENHCINADPQGKTAPCQKGFGDCKIVPPPSCGQGSGTATNGRKIGYYNANNVNTRLCNKVSPSQIITDGYTHLYFAFASIDPTTFKIAQANDGDDVLYKEFTALKSANLQTWIAVGGFDFSDPDQRTHTTWSDMCSSAANRASFISSVIAFMDQYGFSGIDLDWEYPVATERGGAPGDKDNMVSLLKELRAAAGTRYGISVALAPDYWYLRNMDPTAMEQYVDWFGFMAYDLHGFWDAANPNLGPVVRAQTDIRDIKNDAVPLWYAELDPKKINFGIAHYGRGYTLSNSSCNTLGCTYTGPSHPGPCTNFSGVMSSREIQTLISEKNLTSLLLGDSMVKQISWDDQWIGYDDNETIALKGGVANDLCFGGTMVWSVDYDSPGSGDTPGSGGGNNATTTTPIATANATAPITSAAFASCTERFADPDRGITSGYCVCSSSTLPLSTGTVNSTLTACAYTSPLPTNRATITPQSVTFTHLDECQVCTEVGQSFETCTSIPNCTPATPTSPPANTPTAVPPDSTSIRLSCGRRKQCNIPIDVVSCEAFYGASDTPVCDGSQPDTISDSPVSIPCQDTSFSLQVVDGGELFYGPVTVKFGKVGEEVTYQLTGGNSNGQNLCDNGSCPGTLPDSYYTCSFSFETNIVGG